MLIDIKMNANSVILLGVVAGLGYILSKKEKQIKVLKDEIERLAVDKL